MDAGENLSMFKNREIFLYSDFDCWISSYHIQVFYNNLSICISFRGEAEIRSNLHNVL